jgi:GNAT superfamily N-acetyltransferase
MTEMMPASLPEIPQEILAPTEPELSLVTTEPEVQATDDVKSRLKRGAQIGIVVAELSPINELIRGSAFMAGEAVSHNPAVGALTFGLSTLAIEASAAVASASLVTGETNKRFNSFLKSKLESVGYDSDKQMSRLSKTGLTFMGGSVVGMALEQFDDPTRTTEQQRKFGLFTAAWLAGTCAVAGAMGSEAIDYTMQNPATTAAVAGGIGLAAAGRKVRSVFKRRQEMRELSVETQPTVWLDHDKYGNEYGLIQDQSHLQAAAELEQNVWDEKGYGNLEEEGYDVHIEHSRTFGAFKGDKCIAVERMFRAEDGVVPPFLEEEMPFDDESERAELIELAKDGLLEELGTVAVAPEARGKKVNLRLFRLAYRDARARGITHWGIIMEPERVQNMNKHHGFTFKQLGDAVDYQGGACAAHVMNLEEVDRTMRDQHPINHYWFTKLKIRP